MTRLLRLLRWLISRCQHCGRFGAVTYYQRTSYVNDADNIVTLCPSCKRDNDDYWDDMWNDFYSGCM